MLLDSHGKTMSQSNQSDVCTVGHDGRFGGIPPQGTLFNALLPPVWILFVVPQNTLSNFYGLFSSVVFYILLYF